MPFPKDSIGRSQLATPKFKPILQRSNSKPKRRIKGRQDLYTMEMDIRRITLNPLQISSTSSINIPGVKMDVKEQSTESLH